MSVSTELSVVVLTHNEEKNIGACLASVTGWAKEVFIVDSFSTDATLRTATDFNVRVVEHAFGGYAAQRNWALRELPLSTEWVLFLDADERVTPELRLELAKALNEVDEGVNGFYVKRRLVFMGRWIKWGGYYPVWLLRVFRRRYARCADRLVNEHFLVEGGTRRIEGDLIHEDRRGVSHWIAKHNDYATLEAAELARLESAVGPEEGRIHASLFGGQAERKEWLRQIVWRRLPRMLRAFLYFGYRYLVLLGFLDGRPGLVYHFLQGLWFQFLVDVKLLEDENSKRFFCNETAPERIVRD
jgi:glycosyltransferase involved in cell wall biosynthesis